MLCASQWLEPSCSVGLSLLVYHAQQRIRRWVLRGPASNRLPAKNRTPVARTPASSPAPRGANEFSGARAWSIVTVARGERACALRDQDMAGSCGEARGKEGAGRGGRLLLLVLLACRTRFLGGLKGGVVLVAGAGACDLDGV